MFHPCPLVCARACAVNPRPLQADAQLALIHRQSTIAGFYAGERSVMESLEDAKAASGKAAAAAAAGRG